MAIQDKRKAFYLNQDDDIRALPQGDVPFQENCRTVITDSGNSGANENTRGNIQILNPYLQPGTNRVIGSIEDKRDNSIIYFVYNSQGKHSIFRYYPDKVNNQIELILQSPILRFQNKKDFLITSCDIVDDLLYWTDNYQNPNNKDDFNGPRKINLVKANDTGKIYQHNIYGNWSPLYGNWRRGAGNPLVDAVYYFKITGTNINIPWTPVLSIGNGRTDSELVAIFAQAINNNSVVNGLIRAESCGGTLKIFGRNPEQYLTIELKVEYPNVRGRIDTDFIKVVPQNYYPRPYKIEYIDRVKYPQLCEPKVKYGTDISKPSNLVKNKLFQFRTRIVYDDNEKSVWSPISMIPRPTKKCQSGQNGISTNNYILIDFNSSRLNDVNSLATIKRIDIAVREGNTGNWRFVTSLEQDEFIPKGNLYRFYNDGVYEAIDVAEVTKPYDRVPLRCKSHTIADNRLFDGGITEGYDTICVDGKIDVNKQPEIDLDDKVATTIKGKIKIINQWLSPSVLTNQNYRFNQPIHSLDGTSFVFGGFSDADITNGVGTEYHQRIPLGGFTVYLAGTDYYAISKQTTVSNVAQIGTTGVFDSRNGQGRRGDIRRAIRENKCESVFEIPNVKPGKYIFRVASHLVTQQDIQDGTYQRTSTYTERVFGLSGRKEAILEVTSSGDVNVIDPISNTSVGFYTRNTNTGITEITATTNIEDLTSPPTLLELGVTSVGLVYSLSPLVIAAIASQRKTFVVAGYLRDSEGTTITTTKDYLNSTIVNGAGANMNFGVVLGSQDSIVDHNGFFYYVDRFLNWNPTIIISGSSNANLRPFYTNSVFPIYYPNSFTLFDYFTENNTNSNYNINTPCRYFIVDNTDQYVRDYCRTKITGRVIDTETGDGVVGLRIATTKNTTDETTFGGYFDFYSYGLFGSGGRASGIILFSQSAGSCNYQLQFDKHSFNILVGTNQGNYNVNLDYQVPLNSLTYIDGDTSINSFKVGGKYKFGIVYYDRALRDGTVNFIEKFDKYIPFFTDKPDGVNIRGGGIPKLDWEIYHRPPSWATHWQWVRTKNLNQFKYLQWTIAEIQYRDADNQPTTATNAVNVALSFYNIDDFLKLNPETGVRFNFERGDRIVFIKDSNGNYYNDRYEYEVKGVDSSAGLSLIIPYDSTLTLGANCLVEIWNPRKTVDEELFYEFGECFEVGVDKQGRTYHKGLTQDQSPTNPILVPAKGTFRFGDTWVRRREMRYKTGSQPYVTPYTNGLTTNATYAYGIESDQVSDYWSSKEENIGRPNTILPDKGRIELPAGILFSNVYLPGTKINGLSSVEPLSEKLLPVNFGLINRLIYAGNVLVSIHENSETTAMYVNREVFRDSTGQSLVAISDKVISDDRQYQGSFGTQDPATVWLDDENTIWGWDANKGVVWRRTLAGLQDVTIKMRTYFRNKSNQIKDNIVDGWACGVYDRYHKQYILTFPRLIKYREEDTQVDVIDIEPELDLGGGNNTVFNPVPVEIVEQRGIRQPQDFEYPKGLTARVNEEKNEVVLLNNENKRIVVPIEVVPSETLAFSKLAMRWESFYSFKPEYYGIGRNNELVSFLNGTLWRHEKNVLFNNFYGKQFTRKIKFISNAGNSVQKVWLHLSTESSHPFKFPIIKTLEGQLSELDIQDFKLIENVFYADFLRDKNTPNVNLPLLFGDDLRSSSMELLAEDIETGLSVIYALNAYFITSESTNK